eukprot:scaffold28183_cov19-Prasinocladus_malaysianus.AAC.1
MEANGLTLLLRSHEGPDARCRADRPMPSMDPGYSLDHSVPAGRLMTVFSAPDYPQVNLAPGAVAWLGSLYVHK